ncbi:MAG TPA: MmcQ/YjbR family DNA-binding protein [Vicinamibacterales bacterium]
MRARDFRRIVLGMEGAIEGAHMGHPDFRAHGRIFATLNAEETVGVVMLTPDQQQRFLAEYPDIFSPAAGAWGRGGSTLVQLDAADDEDMVGEAVTLAWQNSTLRPRSGQAERAAKRKPVAAKKKAPAAKAKSKTRR